MCNFSQFLLPVFSINSTLILLPGKLMGVSGELITSFQTKRSLHSGFSTLFLWVTKASPCSSPVFPQSLKPEPLLIPGISHFLPQTICQPWGGSPVVGAGRGEGGRMRSQIPAGGNPSSIPRLLEKHSPIDSMGCFCSPLTSLFSSWRTPLPTPPSFCKCQGPQCTSSGFCSLHLESSFNYTCFSSPSFLW